VGFELRSFPCWAGALPLEPHHKQFCSGNFGVEVLLFAQVSLDCNPPNFTYNALNQENSGCHSTTNNSHIKVTQNNPQQPGGTEDVCTTEKGNKFSLHPNDQSQQSSNSVCPVDFVQMK
jgi:hypothetical protein